MIPLAGAFEELLAALDRLEIPFLVGGSVASSTHGIGRQTNDIDILADMRAEKVTEFCEALGPRFYVDAQSVTAAIEAGRGFNVIHLRSAIKFDIFPVGESEFARSEIARRQFTKTSITGIENIEFPVASAEDTILAKLVWFRKGGEVSDRQWNDILGVARTQSGRLDRAYMDHWASELNVGDLLARALAN